LTGHSGTVTSLAISSDGKQLFSGNYDKTIKIWSLPEGTPVKTLTDPSSIYSLAITLDGRRLLSSDGNRVIRLIALPDGIVTRKRKAGGLIAVLSVSPDGKWLASGGSNIRLWNLPKFVLKEKEIADTISSLIFSVDSRLLFSGDYAGRLQIRKLPDLAFEKCLLDLECVKKTVKGSTYSVTDEWGRSVTYTLPCGSPVPAGARCTCNCVPGKICSCDSVCTCNSQCTCNTQRRCSCNQVCTCVPVYR
jgi:WD40 repeat protein